MSFSNYLEQKLLDHVYAGVAYTAPANIYTKLHIGDPGEDGTANPAVETDRVECDFVAGTNPVVNVANVAWLDVSTTETYSHVSLWDDLTAGNPLGKGPLAVAKSVTAGDDFTIPAGDLEVSLD